MTNSKLNDTEYIYEGIPQKESSQQTFSTNYATEELTEELRELTNSTWTDKFFEHGDDDIIAVFDFDHDALINYRTRKEFLTQTLCFPWCLVSSVTLQPCFFQKRIEWANRSPHIAITRDGVLYVQERRHTWCGCECTDVPTIRKTVTFERITNCEVEEPLGDECKRCIDNPLMNVRVYTAARATAYNNDGEDNAELSFWGLKNPHRFMNLLLAMKDMRKPEEADSPPAAESMDRDVPGLIREIRDEINAQTELLKGGIDKPTRRMSSNV